MSIHRSVQVLCYLQKSRKFYLSIHFFPSKDNLWGSQFLCFPEVSHRFNSEIPFSMVSDGSKGGFVKLSNRKHMLRQEPFNFHLVGVSKRSVQKRISWSKSNWEGCIGDYLFNKGCLFFLGRPRLDKSPNWNEVQSGRPGYEPCEICPYRNYRLKEPRQLYILSVGWVQQVPGCGVLHKYQGHGKG